MVSQQDNSVPPDGAEPTFASPLNTHKLRNPHCFLCAPDHKLPPQVIVSSQCHQAMKHSVAVPGPGGNGVLGTRGCVLGTFDAQNGLNGIWCDNHGATEPGTADRFCLG